MNITFHGAAGEVTGSCYLVEVNGARLLLECGLIQGSAKDEQRNHDDFPFDVGTIDAVLLSHAHIDHSGRVPLLVKRGYQGPVYTHRASVDLCRVMLRDAGFLSEKDAEWENRKRERKGMPLVQPLYTKEDADKAMENFRSLEYEKEYELLPGIRVRLQDAGHILGSAIVELWLIEGGVTRKVVFSGDLGHAGAPILRDPVRLAGADVVIMESTYGDRLHRSWEETISELGQVFADAESAKGNILIPAFAVGRSQELLYFFEKFYSEWGLDRWQIFLDSPMAIRATEIYRNYSSLYDEEARSRWQTDKKDTIFQKMYFSHTSEESMRINTIKSGALIIAGSGMCTGGRIRHHLKHNMWREGSHIIIVGFQARGTPGRALVDGAHHLRLWGEAIRVNARVHTIGGLSAHADQAGLGAWFSGFQYNPHVVLVHGEETALTELKHYMQREYGGEVNVAQPGQILQLA